MIPRSLIARNASHIGWLPGFRPADSDPALRTLVVRYPHPLRPGCAAALCQVARHPAAVRRRAVRQAGWRGGAGRNGRRPGMVPGRRHRDATPPTPPTPRDLPAAQLRRLRRRGPAPRTALPAARKPFLVFWPGRGGDEEVLRRRECGAAMVEPGPLDAVAVVKLGVCRMCQVADDGGHLVPAAAGDRADRAGGLGGLGGSSGAGPDHPADTGDLPGHMAKLAASTSSRPAVLQCANGQFLAALPVSRWPRVPIRRSPWQALSPV